MQPGLGLAACGYLLGDVPCMHFWDPATARRVPMSQNLCNPRALGGRDLRDWMEKPGTQQVCHTSASGRSPPGATLRGDQSVGGKASP